MEILKEKGKHINVFGNDYEVIMSLNVLARMEEELGELESLKLDFKTIPQILWILIDDCCNHNGNAIRITEEQIRDGLGPSSIPELQGFIFELLNPASMQETAKNA